MARLFDIINDCPDVKIQTDDLKEEIFSKHPFAREITEKTLVTDNLSLEEFETVICTAVYLNENIDDMVEEFVWRLGGKEEYCKRYFEFEEAKSDKLDNAHNSIIAYCKKEFVKVYMCSVKKDINVVMYHVLQSKYGNEYFFPEKINCRFRDMYYMLEACAYYGNLRLLIFLTKVHKLPLAHTRTSFAAHRGHLNVLKYLVENGCSLDKHTCLNAAKGGYLSCLIYAHENGCEWDKWTCANAAFFGHLDCLRYAHTHGCEWDVHTTKHAAHNGKLECLRYAHENGCVWDKAVCESAAEYGHLECLKYAHEHGCEWDRLICLYAKTYGKLDCLEYAIVHGCPEN